MFLLSKISIFSEIEQTLPLFVHSIIISSIKQIIKTGQNLLKTILFVCELDAR